MEDYRKIKDALLSFAKSWPDSEAVCAQLLKAESMDAVMSVVQGTFFWCAKLEGFAPLLLKYRDTFEQYHIWLNHDIDLRSGSGWLLVSEGSISVTSRGASILFVVCTGSAFLDAESQAYSTLLIESLMGSVVVCRSYGVSTLRVSGDFHSKITATSFDASHLVASNSDWGWLTVTSYGSSVLRVGAFGKSQVKAEASGNSTLRITNHDEGSVRVRGLSDSIVHLRGRFVLRTLHDSSIARHYEDHCVVYGPAVRLMSAKDTHVSSEDNPFSN